MEYDTATFFAQEPGQYDRMVTGEISWKTESRIGGVVPLYVRCADDCVYDLTDLADDAVDKRSFWCLNFETSTGVITGFIQHDSRRSTFYFRNGNLIGADLGMGTEIGKCKDGPYFTLPVTSEQIRELLGPPIRETTFRATPVALPLDQAASRIHDLLGMNANGWR